MTISATDYFNLNATSITEIKVIECGDENEISLVFANSATVKARTFRALKANKEEMDQILASAITRNIPIIKETITHEI